MTEMANERATGIDRRTSPALAAALEHGCDDQRLHCLRPITGPERADPGSLAKMADGRLDLAKAPFRLLAIVNRIDLRGSTAYGSDDAGEARLIFGLLICNPTPPQREVQPFTVNFEYGIRTHSCAEVRYWARQWHALGPFAIGSPAYNAALQAITDQFTRRNADPSKRPNRSALSQLRTNEFALADIPFESFWELREFRICGDAGACGLGQLEETTIAQTPDASFQTFRANGRSCAISSMQTRATFSREAHRSLAAAALDSVQGRGYSTRRRIRVEPGWDHQSRRAPRVFAPTCNGCHTAETGTHFVQISPRNAAVPRSCRIS